MLRGIFFLSLVLASTFCYQQNTVMSRYFYSPFSLNPALAGIYFNGSFRLSTNYRMQYGKKEEGGGKEVNDLGFDFTIPFKKL